MHVNGHLDFKGIGKLLRPGLVASDFPANPSVGEIILKDKKVYICVELVDGMPLWVCMVNEVSMYRHDQHVAALDVGVAVAVIVALDQTFKIGVEAENVVGVNGLAAAGREAHLMQEHAGAEARGQQVDEEADAAMRAAVEGQIEAESLPLVLSGMLYDDGVIDPRDTRTVLGMCLSAIANGPIEGTSNFGVFRM